MSKMRRNIALLVGGLSLVTLLGSVLGYALWQEYQLQQIYTPSPQPQKEAVVAEPSWNLEEDSAESVHLSEEQGMEETEGEVAPPVQAEAPTESAPQEEDTPPAVTAQTEEALEAERVTAEAIEQLYEVQNDYQIKLDQIVDTTIASFLALPPEEQTQDNKMALVDAQYDVISALEQDCDAQVEVLVQRIAKAQNVLGNSSLVNEIRSYYAESKATWKADCLTALATS